VHEDSDGDSPLVFVQFFHTHYVANLLAMNRVILAKVQCDDDVHPDEVVLGGRQEIEPAARHVCGRADFLGKQRIEGANQDGF